MTATARRRRQEYRRESLIIEQLTSFLIDFRVEVRGLHAKRIAEGLRLVILCGIRIERRPNGSDHEDEGLAVYRHR